MNKRVLVVDGDFGMRTLVGIMLKRFGFTVLKAESADQARRMLADVTPDLVIVDVLLPGLSGVELCRDIRTHPRTACIPVLILTARTDSAARELGLQAGADACLSKPVLQPDLVAVVCCLLNSPPG